MELEGAGDLRLTYALEQLQHVAPPPPPPPPPPSPPPSWIVSFIDSLFLGSGSVCQ